MPPPPPPPILRLLLLRLSETRQPDCLIGRVRGWATIYTVLVLVEFLDPSDFDSYPNAIWRVANGGCGIVLVPLNCAPEMWRRQRRSVFSIAALALATTRSDEAGAVRLRAND